MICGVQLPQGQQTSPFCPSHTLTSPHTRRDQVAIPASWKGMMRSHIATAWENPRDLRAHSLHHMEKEGPEHTLASTRARKVHDAAMTINMSAPDPRGLHRLLLARGQTTMRGIHEREPILERTPCTSCLGVLKVHLLASTPYSAVTHIAAAAASADQSYLCFSPPQRSTPVTMCTAEEALPCPCLSLASGTDTGSRLLCSG